jgi:hypothetical protein
LNLTDLLALKLILFMLFCLWILILLNLGSYYWKAKQEWYFLDPESTDGAELFRGGTMGSFMSVRQWNGGSKQKREKMSPEQRGGGGGGP